MTNTDTKTEVASKENSSSVPCSTGFVKDGWHSKKPHVKVCKMPFDVRKSDTEIYKLILRSHCEHPAKKGDNHKCCGVISISEKSILMNCRKCGDAKGLFNS